MEDIRRFERRCLRLCHGGAYRSQESGFIKYATNKKLYDNLNIPRIDNFIISLIRNHIARSLDIVANTLISGPLLSIDVRYAKKCLTSGFIPAEVFAFLDKLGFIQNDMGNPIFYHTPREYPKKRILFDPQVINNLIYDTDIPKRQTSPILQKEKKVLVAARQLPKLTIISIRKTTYI